ncbi:MAG TPA: PGDYG domain-containing protein [Candidatus Limnocylindrales bacterium]|nr:PGDYG domain-containing protein [Candidatus Limnocylindrales bacterium]
MSFEKDSTPYPYELDLQTPEITSALEQAPLYAKNPNNPKNLKIPARQGVLGEIVKTILANGRFETENVTSEGEMIVQHPGGEETILKPDVFAVRYDPTEEEGIFVAKGIVRALQNPLESEIVVEAPWGEKQVGGPDCMIAAHIDPADTSHIGSDRYIVGREEFQAVYLPYEEVYGTEQ